MSAQETSVAIIGAGLMGSAIATRLLECGLAVSVFDLDQEKVAVLAAKGASAASTIADAATACEFIVLSLNHANIVEAVAFGPGGVASMDGKGKLLIDMSSIDPGETRRMALQSDVRSQSREVTGELLKLFTGKVHHHVFEAAEYGPAA